MTYDSNSANDQNPQLKPNFDKIVKIHRFTNSSEQIHGFLVKSTAPINVEDQNDDIIDEDVRQEHPE